jgi:hypothetical protein
MSTASLKVYQAINAVQRALASTGISKDRQASGFGNGYAFRGIDDVYNAIAPLLAEHQLVIIPRCVERTETQRPSGNKTLYFVLVKMEFDFISSEDGSKHVACVFGEAMDSGDKATNKAMSIAYKYACFQTFAIPTEGDNDPDATVHAPGNAQAKPQQAAGQQKQTGQQPHAPVSQQQKPKTITPLNRVLKDIQATKTVDSLTDIKNYVFAIGHGEDGYSEYDFRIIKNQLKAQHDKLIQQPAPASAGPSVSYSNLDDDIPF